MRLNSETNVLYIYEYSILLRQYAGCRQKKIELLGKQTVMTLLIQKLQGVSKKKTVHSWETKTLGTSYSETTYLLDLKLWQQGVLMSTPCCQISTAYRLVVSEYEVPKVLVSQECRLF